MTHHNISRRQLLSTGGVGLATAIAGCIDAPDIVGSSEPSGAAAFFTLMDWGNQVSGSVFELTTPMESGEMGHGWSPDADIVPEIAQHDVFVHLATPEFQWAIDVAQELEAEESSNVHVIDGLEAISEDAFLPFTGESDVLQDPSEEVDGQTAEIVEFEIVYGDEIVAYWHDNHWHGGIPDVPAGDTRRLAFNVVTSADEVVPLGEESDFSVRATPGQGAPDDLIDIDRDDATLVLEGQSTGQTTLIFEVTYDDEVLFETSNDPAVVTVVDAGSGSVDAFYDPHVWVDPIHAQAIVAYFAEEFATVVPDESETFKENANAYIERIQGVHEAFEAMAEAAELNVAVAVAHNAFQYLEDRYSFELRTPVGVTPDAAESIDDIAQLAQTIETHEIDTILYDPFESPNPGEDLPQAARLLIDESDRELEAAPISAAEGSTPEWNEAGYGWVEQMENVNLPSLRKALRADT